jgi:hypothetical protein
VFFQTFDLALMPVANVNFAVLIKVIFYGKFNPAFIKACIFFFFSLYSLVLCNYNLKVAWFRRPNGLKKDPLLNCVVALILKKRLLPFFCLKVTFVVPPLRNFYI